MSRNLSGESRYGVHSIDHFALEVPALAKAEEFFTLFGLEVSPEAHRLALRTVGDALPWSYIYQGPAKRLAYLSFNCFPEEYEGLVAQIKGANGVTPAEGGLPYVSPEGFWFHDPDGNLMQLKMGPKRTPSGVPPQREVARRPGERGSVPRSQVRQVHPTRLSHVLLFTPDVERAIGFCREALGLRLSDRSGDLVAFNHARHGCDHHLVAYAKSSARGWHHSSWDVPSVNEVGLGAEQMRNGGYGEGWGTARHVLGSNYFHYVRDPWGSFAEFSADIDFVPAGTTWPAGNFPPEDSLHAWGPAVPDYFIHNSEA
ncbi:metapyrocatechase [Variovorax sp. WS11]|uniref:VOC family protein n=1 Tax=Variovorax sp. WS11 TaxID=1105204 RepID=UPI000D0CBA89|nr:VOC family protein [Variovorax sp. WS11]NDZ17508.1 metapyrocatechase [Variovorax sp. WS11]PSL85961.1 metapyrocatechase [Variovorax sp. WS11]